MRAVPEIRPDQEPLTPALSPKGERESERPSPPRGEREPERPEVLTSGSASAGDVQHRVGARIRPGEEPDRFRGRHRDDLYAAAFRLLVDGRHHRQRTLFARADDQASALPRDLLLDRKRSVIEFGAEGFRRFLLPHLQPATVDDHVALVALAVNLDAAEREVVDAHCYTPLPILVRQRIGPPVEWRPDPPWLIREALRLGVHGCDCQLERDAGC